MNIDENWNDEFDIINGRFGRSGERVLGFARLDLPRNEFPKGFHFDLDNYNFPFKN